MPDRPVIINNYPTPYRENLFDAIQAEGAAAVIYVAQPEAKRREIGWHASRTQKRDVFQLSDPGVVHRGSRRRLILPLATIVRLVQLRPKKIICTLSRDMVLVQVVALIFAKISQAKIAFWIGDVGDKTLHRGLTGVVDRLRLSCARRADGFIFYSSKSRDWLLSQVPNAAARPCWIGGQVRHPIAMPSTRVRRRWHPVFRLLFVGDETPRKGLAELIDDLSRQPCISGRPVELLCAGGAMPSRTRLSGIRVISLGKLDAEGMRRAYERVDAAIIASLNEPWGFVFNEAILATTPCVVSRHAGSSTVAEKFGLAYEVGRPDTLNETLGRALTLTPTEFDAIADDLAVAKAARSFHRFTKALAEPGAHILKDY